MTSSSRACKGGAQGHAQPHSAATCQQLQQLVSAARLAATASGTDPRALVPPRTARCQLACAWCMQLVCRRLHGKPCPTAPQAHQALNRG